MQWGAVRVLAKQCGAGWPIGRDGMMASSGVLWPASPWHAIGLGALGFEQLGRRGGANPSAPTGMATGWLDAGKTVGALAPSLGLLSCLDLDFSLLFLPFHGSSTATKGKAS